MSSFVAFSFFSFTKDKAKPDVLQLTMSFLGEYFVSVSFCSDSGEQTSKPGIH